MTERGVCQLVAHAEQRWTPLSADALIDIVWFTLYGDQTPSVHSRPAALGPQRGVSAGCGGALGDRVVPVGRRTRPTEPG
jgi:hypothetical protein